MALSSTSTTVPEDTRKRIAERAGPALRTAFRSFKPSLVTNIDSFRRLPLPFKTLHIVRYLPPYSMGAKSHPESRSLDDFHFFSRFVVVRFSASHEHGGSHRNLQRLRIRESRISPLPDGLSLIVDPSYSGLISFRSNSSRTNPRKLRFKLDSSSSFVSLSCADPF